MGGRQGERVEIKQRADGDYQWAKVYANNTHGPWSGEGLTSLEYAWSNAQRENPDLPLLLIDEQGGIIEERRPAPPLATPPAEFERGQRVQIDGREYLVTDITEPDADGRIRIEVINTAKYEGRDEEQQA